MIQESKAPTSGDHTELLILWIVVSNILTDNMSFILEHLQRLSSETIFKLLEKFG